MRLGEVSAQGATVREVTAAREKMWGLVSVRTEEHKSLQSFEMCLLFFLFSFFFLNHTKSEWGTWWAVAEAANEKTDAVCASSSHLFLLISSTQTEVWGRDKKNFDCGVSASLETSFELRRSGHRCRAPIKPPCKASVRRSAHAHTHTHTGLCLGCQQTFQWSLSP